MLTTSPVIDLSRTDVHPSWPFFGEDELKAAAKVLRSGKVNYWTGEEGRLFESEFAEFIGCRYAVAVANGTVALELALRALGVGPGDEVITTSRTFIATASAIVAVGAHPVFADVDLDSQNIIASTIRAVITPKTKAIVAVHLAGWPCDMDPILELAHEHGLSVLEDCAQAHGARYKGRMIGSLGDVAAFSFCQDKIMTTAGEGGMVTTNNEVLWKRMWSYKDHGKSYEAVYTQSHSFGFRWLHETFGTNWRLSEIQSAVGRVQLKKLPDWIAIRRSHAHFLSERWRSLKALRIPETDESTLHAYYKFYAFLRPSELSPGWNRDRIAQAIAARGIPCSVGSCSEIYLEQAFPADMKPPQRLPVALELGATSLMFLVHPTLGTRHIQHTAEVVEEVVKTASVSEIAGMKQASIGRNSSAGSFDEGLCL